MAINKIGMNTFSVELLKKHPHNQASIKKITTPHGEFMTPVFMPVGTHAFVNLMRSDDLKAAYTQIILGGNTYHMLQSPGLEVIESQGGMHKFMGWEDPMLTDSGGFQVFSLAKQEPFCTIDDHGVTFQDPISKQAIYLTPESSLQAQKVLGADIIMAFDQCLSDQAEEEVFLQGLKRTHQWLLQSIHYHQKNPNSIYGHHQALFGIVQGGYNQSLRLQSAEFILNQPVDGIAIGGETIGFDMVKTCEILEWLNPIIPKHWPLYTMGVGLNPKDLLEVSALGVDMFDCVAPTRNARHGSLYVGNIIKKGSWLEFVSSEPKGHINIYKKEYAKQEIPILENCGCFTCQHHTRGYLHYLLRSHSFLYYNLASIHNVFVMNAVCEAMRQCILNA